MEKGQSPQPANPDLLRQEIDQGRGGDKIDYPDPAAAPLGTDDEAAGNPISPEQLGMAMQAEVRAQGGQAPLQSGRQENGSANLRFVLGLILCGALLIALTVLLTR